MNDTLDIFESKKTQARAILEKLYAFLVQGEEAGAYIDPSLKNKLEVVLQNLEGEKLKIALIGGFSEGKTSIAAAWMEKLDKDSMNISHQESSNEVKVYQVDDDCVLIDTPGLFGFKEKYNDDIQTIEKYKDITKKYVSEAHLVLYVMNSTNPIKASHKDDLQWLFRTLNLLPRTIFVLSRFDEVADVEDDWDYRDNLKVKQQNVINRLDDTIKLSDQERTELAVVAVAANPFDMGTEYWLDNLEKFNSLSHIAKLQQATSQKIRANGGHLAIVDEARNSIIRDVLTNQLPKAVENDQRIGEELRRLEEMHIRLKKQLASTQGQITDVKIALRTFVTGYFSDLILQAKGLDMHTFSDFFEREVGNEGVMIETRIKNEFERQLSSVNLEMARLKASFESEVNHYNSAVSMLGKQGLNYVLKSNLINNGSILAARDGISSIAKVIGVDLGNLLKFKPWGAVNLAKGINGALAFVGVALEVWDSWEQHKKEEAFNKAVAQMVKNFEQQRQELLGVIEVEDFCDKFFPDYVELKNSLIELTDCTDNLRTQRSKFALWRKTGETIEGEFYAL